MMVNEEQSFFEPSCLSSLFNLDPEQMPAANPIANTNYRHLYSSTGTVLMRYLMDG